MSRERAAQESAAAIGLALARDRVSVEVERAYRFVARAERGAEVARAAVDARRAALSVMRDRCERGLASAASLSTAEAELAESEARAAGGGSADPRRPRCAYSRDRRLITLFAGE